MRMALPYDSARRPGPGRSPDGDPGWRVPMRPAPKWRASWAPFKVTRATEMPCCGWFATTAGPPTTNLGTTMKAHRRSGRHRPQFCPSDLLQAARRSLGPALELGERNGYRNAQVTVLAPTGTIGLLMDCDTTGIEPDFALVKFKKLAGGGYFKIINQSLPAALRRSATTKSRSRTSWPIAWVARPSTTLPTSTTSLWRQRLHRRGLQAGGSGTGERVRDSVRLQQVHSGRGVLQEALGFTDVQLDDWNFNLLRSIGFSSDEHHEANEYVCGTMTVEGAPHLDAVSTMPCSTAPTGAARRASVHLQPRAHPHDGGCSAVPERRHLQDHQPAVRRDRRGREQCLLGSPGSSGSRPTPFIGTAPSCASR